MTGKKNVRAAGATSSRCIARHPLAAAVGIVLLAGMVMPTAHAVDSHWQGTVSTDWNDPANWDAPPLSGGRVIIDSTSPYPSLLAQPGIGIDQLVVGDHAKGLLELSGGALEVHGTDINGTGVMIGQDPGSEGDVLVSGADSMLSVDEGVQIGGAGKGALSITDGGTANFGLNGFYSEVIVGFGYYGQSADAAGGTGAIAVDGDGSALNYAGGLNLLNGTVNVSDGAHLEGRLRADGGWIDIIGFGQVANSEDSLVHSYAVDGEGAATISGAGSSWQSANALYVGDGGSGRLSILDGAKAGFSGWVVVGLQTTTLDYIKDPETNETMVVPAGSKMGAGIIEVSGQDSSLSVSAADLLGAGNLTVGVSGDGTLSVDDGGSVDVAGILTVGEQVAGTLTVSGGGMVAVHGSDANGSGGVFGNSADGVGEATVSGAGSVLTLDAGAQIGNFGRGSLTVQQGGKVNVGLGTPYSEIVAGLGYYGLGGSDAADSTGTIRVDGTGSELNYAGGMNLLNGSLAIGHGAHVASQVRSGDQGAFWLDVLGYGLPADSDIDFPELVGKVTATVSGAGSTWTSVNALTVGDGGSGTLQVLDGGAASFLGEVYLGDAAQLYQNGNLTGLSRAGSGTVEVAGKGSSLTVATAPDVGIGGAGNLVVGYRGKGTLSVADGGSVDAAGMLWVGYQAKGTLEIEGGGSLSVHGSDDDGVGMTLGHAVGSDATVTVKGAGSTLVVDGGAWLGDMGDSMMTIADGGSASFHGSVRIGAGDTAIAAGSAVESDVTVTGAGSALTVAASPAGGASKLVVGGSDPGRLARLTTGAGAAVHVAAGIEVAPRGQVIVGGYDTAGKARAPGVIDTPSMKLDASEQAASLIFSHSGSDYVLPTSLSGSGGIDVAAGFTRLTGNSSGFSGHTAVDSGATLSVNGTLGGDIAVLPGGRLQGTGTVNDVTVGGTLAPGNSPGTLHVDGDLVMQTGSTYEAQIDPSTGLSDSVEVAGNVTIEPGTTLEIQNIGDQPLVPGGQINLIQSTGKGTVQGQFDNTEGDITDFMGYDVTYAGGKVVVGVTRSSTSFASVGDTPQAQALGAALDGVPTDSALGLLLFGQLTSAGQAATAFKSMSGTLHADLRRVMLDQSRSTRGIVEQRLRQVPADGTSWWLHALGGWGSTDGSGGLGDAKADESGVVTGVDTDIGDGSRLGAAVGLGQTSYRMDGQGSAHLRNRQLTLYGLGAWKRFRLGYGVAAGWHDIDTHRSFMVGSVGQQLNGDSRARTDQVFLDAGYRLWDGERGHAEPFVEVAHVSLHGHALHEYGGATALDVGAGDDNATFGTLGLRWSADAGAAHWYGTLGWRHVFGFERPFAQAQFAAGGTAFAIQGLPMARNAARIALGASFDIGRHARASFGYDGLIAGSSRDHGANARLTVDF